mmetsp:Transcript_40662/g.95459  ORF Transcript_40662/g.95459 Transcript_40662/m.95459 type:complete len:183 (-) Transcript_40662:413-961(-)
MIFPNKVKVLFLILTFYMSRVNGERTVESLKGNLIKSGKSKNLNGTPVPSRTHSSSSISMKIGESKSNKSNLIKANSLTKSIVSSYASNDSEEKNGKHESTKTSGQISKYSKEKSGKIKSTKTSSPSPSASGAKNSKRKSEQKKKSIESSFQTATTSINHEKSKKNDHTNQSDNEKKKLAFK